MAGEAVNGLRSAISDNFGRSAVPEAPRFYKSRAKNAQEAHEAIRPTKPYLRPQASGLKGG